MNERTMEEIKRSKRMKKNKNLWRHEQNVRFNVSLI